MKAAYGKKICGRELRTDGLLWKNTSVQAKGGNYASSRSSRAVWDGLARREFSITIQLSNILANCRCEGKCEKVRGIRSKSFVFV